MTAEARDFQATPELRGDMRRWRTGALIAGLAGAALCLVGLFVSPTQFYRSYLWAYMLAIGLSLGAMAWLMLQYLTGGAWGVVIRRPCEAAARTFPLLLLMFAPVLIGVNNLFVWAHPDRVNADEILRHKHPYLNLPFFGVRAAIYFGGWLFLAWFFTRWSDREDREGPGAAHRKLAALSGPGIVFWAFSVTFMAIDWVLSLNPHWFSTIFGMLFMAGQGLSSMAFLITLLVLLSYAPPMSQVLTPRHLHDLGKLLLTMVMLWAYFTYSQFLIIWAGNLPEEITWYRARLNGGWQYVGLALVLLHFALPFALLLSRDLKRNFKLLAGIAISILVMRAVDMFWLVAPDFRQQKIGASWMDLAAPLGILGLWLWYFLLQLEKRPLMPLRDPHLVEALRHGRE